MFRTVKYINSLGFIEKGVIVKDVGQDLFVVKKFGDIDTNDIEIAASLSIPTLELLDVEENVGLDKIVEDISVFHLYLFLDKDKRIVYRSGILL